MMLGMQILRFLQASPKTLDNYRVLDPAHHAQKMGRRILLYFYVLGEHHRKTHWGPLLGHMSIVLLN